MGESCMRQVPVTCSYPRMVLTPVLVGLATLSVVCCRNSHHGNQDIHGGVKMGEPNHHCDDGKTNLRLDWDNSTDYEYHCYTSAAMEGSNTRVRPYRECISKDKMPLPIHKCMNTPIFYSDRPPRAGPHRPLWPVYGEYEYLPPQRWVHALEHGAAVFLYHPCADPQSIEVLKSIAKSCLRKHIITPYRELPTGIHFAVVTYGCRLMLGTIDEDDITEYVRSKAMKAPESLVSRHGDYELGLLEEAQIVSDLDDTVICPAHM